MLDFHDLIRGEPDANVGVKRCMKAVDVNGCAEIVDTFYNRGINSLLQLEGTGASLRDPPGPMPVIARLLHA